MKWIIFALAFSAIISLSIAEGDVVVLTDETYEDTLAKNDVVMVKFFAPWCGHCKHFAPEYEAAAKQAKEQKKNYVLAELDATVHKKAAEKEKIEGFPTIKLFLKGKPIDYNGERTAAAVLSFIDKKTSPPSTELKTVDEIKAKKGVKGLISILALADEKMLPVYEDMAKVDEVYQYYHAQLKLLQEVFPGVEANNIVVLKDFDEGMAIYKGQMKAEEIKEFLQFHMIPTVTEVTQQVIEQVFRSNARKGIFLFRTAGANSAEMEAEFKKVATALKSKEFIFVQTDIKEGWGQRVANYFGIDESSLPALEYVEMKEEPLRYRYSGAFKEAEMKQFIEKAKKGEATRFLKSEPIPTENEGPVFKIVGKNFKKEVIENDMDVIVKFYAPWCGHCKKLEPIFKSLAESLADNKKIKFAEVDSTKNDIEGHPIQGFPVIKFFPGKDKNDVHTYNGDRSEADIAKFIKEKASYPVNIPELKAKDEGEKNKDDL